MVEHLTESHDEASIVERWEVCSFIAIISMPTVILNSSTF